VPKSGEEGDVPDVPCRDCEVDSAEPPTSQHAELVAMDGPSMRHVVIASTPTPPITLRFRLARQGMA
jgi:hypothetical protein